MKSNQRKRQVYLQMRKSIGAYIRFYKSKRMCYQCTEDTQEPVYMTGFGKHPVTVDFRLRSSQQIIQLQTSIYTPFCKCGNFIINGRSQDEIMRLAKKRFNVKRLSELKMYNITLMTS
jgi:hypothetical protein